MKVLLRRLRRLLFPKRRETAGPSDPPVSSRKGRQRIRWIALLLLAAVLGTAFRLVRTMEELSARYAESKLAYLAGRAINGAVDEAVARLGEEPLAQIETDAAGNVSAIRIDMARTSRLKTDVTALVLERIDRLPAAELSIPLGSLFPNRLLSGRGPALPVRLLPLGDVETRLESRFLSAGINQTCHRIVLTVTAHVGAMFAGCSAWTEVVSSVNVAETVIVGGVPNAYTYLEDTGLDGMDIYGDFDLTGRDALP